MRNPCSDAQSSSWSREEEQQSCRHPRVALTMPTALVPPREPCKRFLLSLRKLSATAIPRQGI